MDEIIESLASTIGDRFANYFSSLDNILEMAQAAPMDQISGFPSQELWNTSSQLALTIGAGVASTIVAFFLLFELISLFNRSEAKGMDGIYFIMMVILKAAIAMALCKNMTTIIGACFQIVSIMVQNISDSNLFSNTLETNLTIADQLTEHYKDAGFGPVLGGWLVSFLCELANNLCMTLADIICKLRFIEIYVFVAIAPVPFCTLINREYKNIGISYLKRLIALGMQGLFIAIVCFLYIAIVNATMADVSVADSGATTAMFTLLGYSLLLIIALFQTGGWSKSLLQVN
ncbi:VirB6/TrbL-like conjugal transfer protein, CD1112 family [Faecalicoccus acidiformans]|uniref:Type IV secretion system protein n=1 Tax=Faecalicoccus acidiformans TaxID=915173 RepID=A0ABS2FMG5_9FIRM|nr:type IV secretion system protein [Faecalicoccus acidiformans]